MAGSGGRWQGYRAGGEPVAAKANGTDDLALRLARGESVAAAAKAMNVPERTAYRWASAADFKARVRELRREMVAAAVGRLSYVADAAVVTLASLLKSEHPASVRCGAARAILG